jgi:uncharacterized protein (DUF433 family)
VNGAQLILGSGSRSRPISVAELSSDEPRPVGCDRMESLGDTMNLMDRITIDPAICHGKPILRGLRYPVETILELLSSGMTPEEILADYEDLEREDILAALAFATRITQIKRIEPAVA